MVIKNIILQHFISNILYNHILCLRFLLFKNIDLEGVVVMENNTEISNLEIIELQHKFELSMQTRRESLEAWKTSTNNISLQEAALFNSVITIGQNTLKYIFFMNGGATIALLTIIANNWSLFTISEDIPFACKTLLHAIKWFACGIMLVVLSYGSSYFTQMRFHYIFGLQVDEYFKAFKENRPFTILENKIGYSILAISVIFAALSVLAFYKGLNCATGGFL